MGEGGPIFKGRGSVTMYFIGIQSDAPDDVAAATDARCVYSLQVKTKDHSVLSLLVALRYKHTERQASSVKCQAAALQFWRLGWRMGMGLGPILERHNAFQWDLAAAVDAAA